MAFELRVKDWRSYVPIVDVIQGYRREDFNHDLVAGLVVGMITVPQAPGLGVEVDRAKVERYQVS